MAIESNSGPLAHFQKNKEDYEECPCPVSSWFANHIGTPWHEANMNKRLFDQWEKWCSQVENYRRGYIYLLKSGDLYKIGRTDNPSDRIKTLKIQLPFPVSVYVVKKVSCSYEMEKFLHTSLADFRVNGEWFKLNDWVAESIRYCLEEGILN